MTYETPKREILVFYYKYRLRLWLAFFLPFLIGVAVSFVPTPHYEATSTMVVRLGSEYVYQPEVGASANGQPSPIPFERDQIYKAEVAILGSYDLHEQVIEAVGLDRMYPAGKRGALHRALLPLRDWALRQVNGFAPFAEDTIIGQSLLSAQRSLRNFDDDDLTTDEEKAQRHLETAVQSFNKALNINLGKDSAVIEVAFQHKNRDIAIESLDTLTKLYLEKRKQLYLDTRSSLARQQVDAIRHRADVAQAAVEAFKRGHQIYSLADQRAQLLAQREDVRKQMLAVANPVLEDRMAEVTRQLDALDALDRKYNMLQHEVQVANDEYSLYAHKMDEALAYDNMERARAGSVRVIQPPAAPPEPKRLQGIIVLASFILSLVVTALVAAATEFSRSGFLTPERLEHNLKLPILAALPLRKK